MRCYGIYVTSFLFIFLVPIHVDDNHWFLALIDFRKEQAILLDSMGRRRDSTVKSLLEYLRLEHKDKKEGTPFDTSKFEEQNVQKTTGEF